MKRIGVLVCLVLGIIGMTFISVVVFIDYSTPKGDRFLIPPGYAGWLCIKYGVEGAPLLEMQDGFRLVRFSATGYVETSSELRGGKMKDEFFYDENGARSLVNVKTELGGGYTVFPNDGSGQSISKFWVARNARAEFHDFVEGKSDDCGPFRTR